MKKHYIFHGVTTPSHKIMFSNQSYLYGENNTWSLLASNNKFDLFATVNTNSYLSYIANNVILKNENLKISYNYADTLLGAHLKSSDQYDRLILQTINPMLLFSQETLEKKVKYLARESTTKNTPRKYYGK